MRLQMSKQARQELLQVTKAQYQQASWKERSSILDAFTRATGYNRKYATFLLGQETLRLLRKRQRRPIYTVEVVEALRTVWLATNRIASKRLIPFLPVMIEKLEFHGHLKLSADTKRSLLKMSASTADRLLKEEKRKYGRSKSTTRPGRLNKTNVPVRTFAQWDDAEPGFFEADLVAHCGGVISGIYLHTLTMTDISTGWIELLPVFGKSEEKVLAAIRQVASVIPFHMKGLDTDNGTEFMNYGTIEWCEKQGLTFTRSREYKKNDQAHVEEKNGSIVRRIVGYDRFETTDAHDRMRTLYEVARLYINFFQPSMKLVTKQREGANVRKKYDKAQTPYQRLLSSSLPRSLKLRLQRQFETLNPVALLKKIEECQIALWSTATIADPKRISQDSLTVVLAKAAGAFNNEEVLTKARSHQLALKTRIRTKVSDPPPSRTHGNQTLAIQNFILSLPAGAKFRTENILALGHRSNADRVLKRLLESGKIHKLKKGTFVRSDAQNNKCIAEEPVIRAGSKPLEDFISSLAPGQTVRFADFLQFGARPTAYRVINKALRDKVLVKLRPGRYFKPIPDEAAVINSIAILGADQ